MIGYYGRNRNHSKTVTTGCADTHAKYTINYDAYKKLPYSMNDFVKHAPKVLLKYTIQSDNRERVKFIKNLANKKYLCAEINCRSLNRFLWLYKDFAPYMPGLTKEMMGEIYTAWKQRLDNRWYIKCFKTNIDNLQGRLYPLSKGRYNQFAVDTFHKRNSDRYGLRTLDGVNWGMAESTLLGGRVISRYLGCEIKEGRLVFTCADQNIERKQAKAHNSPVVKTDYVPDLHNVYGGENELFA